MVIVTRGNSHAKNSNQALTLFTNKVVYINYINYISFINNINTMKTIHMKPGLFTQGERLERHKTKGFYSLYEEDRYIMSLALVRVNRKSLTFEGYMLGKRFRVCVNRTEIDRIEGGEDA